MATPQEFRIGVQSDATTYLIDLVGEDRARAAAARVGMAFAAAARAARDPGALYGCSRESVVACIAICALTGLMPGGPSPMVWLIPKASELQLWLSHRGICALALRAGYQLIPIPVHRQDAITIEFGEVTAHAPQPDSYPTGMADLLGVYVTVRRLSDGATLARPWMPVQAIEARRRVGARSGPWTTWPVEMAMKTGIKWALSRGYIPLADPDLDAALGAEPAEHLPQEVTATSSTTQPRGRAALGLEPRQIAEDTTYHEDAEVVTAEHAGDAPL